MDRYFPYSYVEAAVTAEEQRLRATYQSLAANALTPNLAMHAAFERDRGIGWDVASEFLVAEIPVVPQDTSAAGLLQAIVTLRSSGSSL